MSCAGYVIVSTEDCTKIVEVTTTQVVNVVTEGPTGPTGATGAKGDAGSAAPKALTIVSPTAAENIVLYYTTTAQNLTEIRSAVKGVTPSVTFSLRYGTDTSLPGTEVVTGGITATSTTTGNSTTSFTNSTIPSGNFVWLTTSAISGTVTQLSVSILFA